MRASPFLLLGLGHQQEGDAAVARLHALGARHPARGGERELLVILGGDGPVPVLDRVRSAALRLFHSLGVGAARGGDGLVTPCTNAMLCLSTVSELVPTLLARLRPGGSGS